jgi:hypothetical protein
LSPKGEGLRRRHQRGKIPDGFPSVIHPVVTRDVWVVCRCQVDFAPILEDVLGLLAVVDPLSVELAVPLLEDPRQGGVGLERPNVVGG